MRTVAIMALVILAAASLAGPVLAKGTAGKVAAIEGDKVVVQVGKADFESFPVGTRGIDIKTDEGVSVRGKVVAAKGNKLTFRIMRGKASSLAVGASIVLEKAMKSGSEEMQGC